MDTITNYFPPEPTPKGALIPLIFSGLIVAIFLYYFQTITQLQANLSNMSFWGILFAGNYVLILLVIVAFWVKINLINTLWILLALSPVTLFTMNKGLTPENCHISGFQKPIKSKSH